MPGMKDKVSYSNNNEKIILQKRLVLWILSDAYEIFKKENPSIKISFSKFASLRPKECVLAGASGTHNVCVCMIHENIRLMCKPVGSILDVKNEKDLLVNISCGKRTITCAKNKCNDCEQRAVTFKNNMIEKLYNHSAREIHYQQWLIQDRYSIQTVVKDLQEFADELMYLTVNKLKLHDFIANNQSQFLKEKKRNLRSGEYILLMDYSENYSMINQDEIQAAHFSKVQATIHPIVGYYLNESGELAHFSFTIISDYLSHHTVAVHLFQRKCIEYVRSQPYLPQISHIDYFTDGSAAQYKNKKNFANISHHLEDFGVPAAWHFFATSHGKGPSDGLGGTLKREARRASLRGIKIATAVELFNWAKNWSSHDSQKIKYCFVSETEIEEHESYLQERFCNLKTISGTQGYHSFKADYTEKYKIESKIISNSTDYVHHYLKKKINL